MRLGALRRHWDRFGRRDPFWAVLTDPSKHRGGWDPDEFFREGVEEIAAALHRGRPWISVSRVAGPSISAAAWAESPKALASHFERRDGVDISGSVLRAAASHNRHPDRCIYHLNAAPDLALFGYATFNFAYSTLVLQHMEPRYSKGRGRGGAGLAGLRIGDSVNLDTPLMFPIVISDTDSGHSMPLAGLAALVIAHPRKKF